MISKLFSPKEKALQLPQSSFVRLNFQLRHIRWHRDTKPPMNVFLVHDALGSAKSFSTFADALINLPTEGKSPNIGLNLFTVELRNHCASPQVNLNGENVGSALLSSNTATWDNVQDVVQLVESLGGSPSGQHIVGHGALGGNIAMLSALARPKIFKSLAVVNGGAQVSATRAKQYETEASLLEKLLTESKPRTLREANSELAKSVPNEVERYSLLQHLRETSNVDGTQQVGLVSNLGNIKASLQELCTFPTPVIKEQDPHYLQPTTFIGAKSRALVPEEKGMFPGATSIGVGASFNSKLMTKDEGKQLAYALLDHWGIGAALEDKSGGQEQL